MVVGDCSGLAPERGRQDDPGNGYLERADPHGSTLCIARKMNGTWTVSGFNFE
jgi:hypothetical protein